MPDWPAIEKDFAAGLSLRVLATKYGVSKSAIHKHCNPPVDKVGTDGGQSVDNNGQASTDIVALTRRLVDQLATIAKTPLLDLKEHGQIANALSQYNKIIQTAPTDQELPKGIDWSIFNQEELDIIQPIFAAAEERKRIADGESGIPQLRKTI